MNDDVFKEYVVEVLSSLRSCQTKVDSLRILRFLNASSPNWIRSRDLMGAVPPRFDTQYYRLVKRLAACGVIEVYVAETSRAPGKKPVYYRMPRKRPESCFDLQETAV